MAAQTTASSSEPIIHILADELHASDRQEAITHLATAFARQAGMADARALITSAMEREENEPTYLGKGMALPHARVEKLSRPGVCIACSAAGIPWNEEQAHLIAFLAVPEEQPELYLHLMSHIVRWRLRQGDKLSPSPSWEPELRVALA